MGELKMREEFEAGWGFTNEEQDCYFIPELNAYGSERVNRAAESKSTAWHYFQKGWQASRAALPTWQPMESCPKHVDVLFFNERNGVIPGRLTDADSLMTDKERDEWGGDEEGQFRIDAFGFGHWGVDRMDGSETPSHWMPYPEEPVVASVLGETVSVPKELV